MLLANLDHPDTYEAFLTEPVFVRALTWLRRMPDDQPQGIVELQGQDVYVNVHGYETLSRAECRFESHRRYIDLQYCIRGGELIDHCPLDRISRQGNYDEATDFLFHDAPVEFSTLRMAPRDFAIFFPQDAHRPKVRDGRHPAVEKLVIKIACSLLQQSR